MSDDLMKDLEQLEEASQEEQVSESSASEESIAVGDKTYTAKEIEELERGNLRYADYTKKTQELAKQRKSLEEEKSKSSELQAAEQKELDEWRRLDKLIMSDPRRLEQFKAIVSGVQGPQDQPATQVPPELQQQIEELRAAEEDRRLQQELDSVKGLVGDLSAPEEEDFFSFVREMQERVEGIIPLQDAARMYPKFHERLVEKAIASRQKEQQSRSSEKAKTKNVASGKKAVAADGTPTDDEFLADIEKMLG